METRNLNGFPDWVGFGNMWPSKRLTGLLVKISSLLDAPRHRRRGARVMEETRRRHREGSDGWRFASDGVGGAEYPSLCSQVCEGNAGYLNARVTPTGFWAVWGCSICHIWSTGHITKAAFSGETCLHFIVPPEPSSSCCNVHVSWIAYI